ncbi:MAG TPA: hypothetical protein VJL29_00620 [Thermoguttaceae bacterium]|nr:hypothetical protein [Thermoguttaceae bacterium]
MSVELGITVVDAGATVTFEQMARAVDGTGAAAQRATERYKYLNLSAKQLYNETRTPGEQHNRRLAELDRLLKTGKIDQDLYNRSVQRAGDAFRQADAAGSKAFGGTLKSKIAGMATAIVPFASGAAAAAVAIGAITSAANEAHSQVKGLAEELRGTEETLKRLWQVSGSKAAYKQLSGSMKLAMAQEGLAPEEAGQMVFSLKSAGLEKDAVAIAATKRFTDPQLMSRYWANLNAVAGKGTYTVPQAVSGLVVGAEKSQWNQEETAKIFQEVASDARALNTKPGEVLGIASALSYEYSSPEIERTGLRALVKETKKWRAKAEAKGLVRPDEGKGILENIDLMRQRDPEYYSKRKLTEIEFSGAAERLEKKRKEAGSLTQEIQGAFTGTGGQYQQKLDTPHELNVIQRRRVAEMQAKVANEPRAQAQMALDTLSSQGDVLSGLYDTPLGIEKFVAKAADKATTYGFIRKAQELSSERLINKIIEQSPGVYEKKLKPYFPLPVSGTIPQGEMEWDTPQRYREIDLPGPMTEQQAKALSEAIAELTTAVVESRAATSENADATRANTDATQNAARSAPKSNPSRNHRDNR